MPFPFEFDVVTGEAHRPGQHWDQVRAVLEKTRKTGLSAVIEDESGHQFLVMPCRPAPREPVAAADEDDDE